MVPSSTTAAGAPETRSARIAQSAGYFAAFIAMGMYGASLGPTLPGLAAQTGSGLSQISILFSARALGYLVGSVATGRLYDRLSGNRVMAVMLALMMVGMIAAPAIALLPLLVGVFLFLGITEAGVDVGGNTLIVWRHGARVGPFMNAMHFCYGVGAFIAPIVVAQAILRSGGITWAYRVLALLMLPAVIWVGRTPSPRPPAAHEQEGLSAPRPWPVFLIALLLFLFVAAEASYGGWVYTYALKLGIGSVTAAAYLTSAFWGAFTLGRLVSIPLAARFRPAQFLLGNILICLARPGDCLAEPQFAAGPVGWHVHLRIRRGAPFPDDDLLRQHTDDHHRPRHRLVSGRRQPRRHGLALADRPVVRTARPPDRHVVDHPGDGAIGGRVRAVDGRCEA